MKFFNDLKKSIYDPDYYSGLTENRFSYSLKYFFVLILLLTILNTVFLSFTLAPKIAPAINTLESTILQHYPDNLEVTISKGKVSTNVKEPYIIKAPAGNDIKDKMPNLENILVIDTKSDFSLAQFKSYKTYAFLNQENFVYYDSNNKITIMNLANMPDFKLNKSVVSAFFVSIHPIIKFIYPLCILLLFVLVFIGLMAQLVYLLFASLLIWFIAIIKKITIGYKKSYQLGLHLLTLPLLLGFLFNIFYMFSDSHWRIPFLSTAILVIMAFINLKSRNAP